MNFQKLSIKMVTVLLTLSFGVTAPLCFAAEPLQPLSQSQQKQPTEGPSIVPSTPVDLVGATKTEPAKVNGFNDSPLSPASDDGEGVKTQAVSTKTEATSQPAISGASEAKKEGQAIGTQASGEQSQEPGSLSDSQVLKEMPKVNSDIPLTFDEKMII